MERENAWKSYSDKDLDKLEKLSSDYIEFISENKTERECVNASITMAEKAGYKPLAKAIKKQRKLKAGDKVIVEGLQKIRPGSPVRIAEPTPVKQGAPASEKR